MAELRVHELSMERFVNLIECFSGFSFARFSDGGFFCMQGRSGENCDGVVYTEEQAKALYSAMCDREIWHGITSIAISAAKADVWLEEIGVDVVWHDADVMNKAMDTGKLFPFVQCLRERRDVLCGAEHLSRLKSIPILEHVVCHPTQAFEQVDELEITIVESVDRYGADTVLLSAGQGASPTLVSRLHRQLPEVVIIDTGSIWDPYCGVFSRSGHKRMGVKGMERLKTLNFGQEVYAW